MTTADEWKRLVESSGDRVVARLLRFAECAAGCLGRQVGPALAQKFEHHLALSPAPGNAKIDAASVRLDVWLDKGVHYFVYYQRQYAIEMLPLLQVLTFLRDPDKPDIALEKVTVMPR